MTDPFTNADAAALADAEAEFAAQGGRGVELAETIDRLRQKRDAANQDEASPTVVLIDASGSMTQPGVWQHAIAVFDEVIKDIPKAQLKCAMVNYEGTWYFTPVDLSSMKMPPSGPPNFRALAHEFAGRDVIFISDGYNMPGVVPESWRQVIVATSVSGPLKPESEPKASTPDLGSLVGIVGSPRLADHGIVEVSPDLVLYEKCLHCHLFIDVNDSYDPNDPRPAVRNIAPFVHLHRGDGPDTALDESHEPEPSGRLATLLTWKTYGPLAMRERFTE